MRQRGKIVEDRQRFRQILQKREISAGGEVQILLEVKQSIGCPTKRLSSMRIEGNHRRIQRSG